MQPINGTEVRKNWSSVCDQARVRPNFIKRTHDRMCLLSEETLLKLLSNATFECFVYAEEDGSFTAALNSIDLAENGKTREDALDAISKAIYEYAEEYYDAYDLYSRSPNRAPHLPYVIKALLLGSAENVRKELIWQNGAN